MRLILGSQSPRRAEILRYFNIPFDQITHPFDEESIPFLGDPHKYALEIALGKALSLAKSYPSSMILTADTVVFQEGKVYGKPKDEKEAAQFLKKLAGRWHEVYTGVVLVSNQQIHSDYDVTKILLNPLTEQQIHIYQSSFHCLDKAGAFQIQGGAGLIVNKIEGCYYNVIGLPLNPLQKLLKKVGIDIWEHLK